MENAGNAVPGSLEYWALQKPDEAAIIEGGASLTWKEWNRQANQLAHALAQMGLKKNDIAAVRTQTRMEWFVANRALTKLGCSTLTVNWRLTPSELRYMLEDSGAKALIFDDPDPSVIVNELKDINLKGWITMDQDKAVEGTHRFEDLVAGNDAPERFASQQRPPRILYTSGTTGKPKGVYLPEELLKKRRKEIAEYLEDLAKRTAVDLKETRTLLTLPLHHGAGPNAAERAHAKGNLVVLLRKYDAEKVLQLIDRYKITNWLIVPTMLSRLSALPIETLEKYDVSSLRLLSSGAAPFPATLKKWLIDYFGPDCLYESYGSSETGLVTLMTPDQFSKKLESSGKPYKHVYISVRDEEGNELPPGETGELWIKTPLTIERYLNREALGRDSLDENGYFRVGDVGYVDEEGYLYITDRKKDMIISGGVNIYPAEIEAVLLKHPGILDAAVIGIPHDDFGEQVMAVCEKRQNSQVDVEELLQFCAQELASYKRPRIIKFVDELPRNAMGKILKKKLKEPYWKEREKHI